MISESQPGPPFETLDNGMCGRQEFVIAYSGGLNVATRRLVRTPNIVYLFLSRSQSDRSPAVRRRWLTLLPQTGWTALVASLFDY